MNRHFPVVSLESPVVPDRRSEESATGTCCAFVVKEYPAHRVSELFPVSSFLSKPISKPVAVPSPTSTFRDHSFTIYTLYKLGLPPR